MVDESVNQGSSENGSTSPAPWEAANAALQRNMEDMQAQIRNLVNLFQAQAAIRPTQVTPDPTPPMTVTTTTTAPPPNDTQEHVFDSYYIYPPPPLYTHEPVCERYPMYDPYYEYPSAPQPYAYPTPTPDYYTQEPMYEPSYMYPPVPQPYVYPEPPPPPYEPQPIPSSYYPYVEHIVSIDDDPISLVGSEEDEGFLAGNQVLHDDEPDEVVDVTPEDIDDDACVAEVDYCVNQGDYKVDANESDLLVIRRPLPLKPEAKDVQREMIFHTRCTIAKKVCSLIIDGGSCTNVASITMLEKLQLATTAHPATYKVHWLSKNNELRVDRQALIPFSIGKNYVEEVVCDVLPMEACHLLLGRPWLYDRRVMHDGRNNTYHFRVHGQNIKLNPLRPSQVRRYKTLFVGVSTNFHADLRPNLFQQREYDQGGSSISFDTGVSADGPPAAHTRSKSKCIFLMQERWQSCPRF